jgi:hypothetical protein
MLRTGVLDGGGQSKMELMDEIAGGAGGHQNAHSRFKKKLVRGEALFDQFAK